MNLSSGTLQVTEWQFLVSHREMTFVFLLFEEPEEMSSQIVMTSLVSESQCAWRPGWFRKGALGQVISLGHLTGLL